MGAKAVAMLVGVPGAPVPPPRTSDRQPGRPLGASSAPIEGEAKFIVVPDGIDLTIEIRNCNAPVAGYVVEIRDGYGCSGANLKGPIWEATRGAQLPSLPCANTAGRGVLYHTHLDSSPKPWTVGGTDASNVVRHTVVIRDPGFDDAPVSCGIIMFDPSSVLDAGVKPAEQASADVKLALAGGCVWKEVVGGRPNCPDAKKVVSCLKTHCELSRCLRECADTVSCLADAGADPCVTACTQSGVRLTATAARRVLASRPPSSQSAAASA